MLEKLYEIEDELTESINIRLNDETIDKAKCSLIAYNCHIKEDGSETDVIYNPKKNPDKAVDINFEYPDDNLNIEIFLDTIIWGLTKGYMNESPCFHHSLSMVQLILLLLHLYTGNDIS